MIKIDEIEHSLSEVIKNIGDKLIEFKMAREDMIHF